MRCNCLSLLWKQWIHLHERGFLPWNEFLLLWVYGGVPMAFGGLSASRYASQILSNCGKNFCHTGAFILFNPLVYYSTIAREENLVWIFWLVCSASYVTVLCFSLETLVFLVFDCVLYVVCCELMKMQTPWRQGSCLSFVPVPQRVWPSRTVLWVLAEQRRKAKSKK